MIRSITIDQIENTNALNSFQITSSYYCIYLYSAAPRAINTVIALYAVKLK
jgi:hypothetical protein